MLYTNGFNSQEYPKCFCLCRVCSKIALSSRWGWSSRYSNSQCSFQEAYQVIDVTSLTTQITEDKESFYISKHQIFNEIFKIEKGQREDKGEGAGAGLGLLCQMLETSVI